MLVLSRKAGESLVIGDGIVVSVLRIGPTGVRIGIEAPPEVVIVREELLADERVEFVQHAAPIVPTPASD